LSQGCPWIHTGKNHFTKTKNIFAFPLSNFHFSDPESLDIACYRGAVSATLPSGRAFCFYRPLPDHTRLLSHASGPATAYFVGAFLMQRRFFMATAAQINANRANAQKSTGPRSVEGKTASSLNALKHGADAASAIIPGEDPALYERIVAEYRRDLQPYGAIEEFQVDTIIRADWQRRRLQRIETNLYRQLLSEGITPGEIDVKVLRDSPTGKLLLKIWSQLNSLDRASHRALSELRRIRRERHQKDLEEIEQGLALPPGAGAIFAAAREQWLQRNEPNSPAKPAPDAAPVNPALPHGRASRSASLPDAGSVPVYTTNEPASDKEALLEARP
jgi:hypothetical protein